jgi:hypothetical protein
MEEKRLPHDPEKWRHFTDAGKLNLKAVLLHNGKANNRQLLTTQ